MAVDFLHETETGIMLQAFKDQLWASGPLAKVMHLEPTGEVGSVGYLLDTRIPGPASVDRRRIFKPGLPATRKVFLLEGERI